MIIDLKDLTVPQLLSMRSIIKNGPVATSEVCKCGHKDGEEVVGKCEQTDMEIQKIEEEVSEMGDKEKTTDAVEAKVENADPKQSEQEAAQTDDKVVEKTASVSDDFMNEVMGLRKENEELRSYKEQKELAELKDALLASRKEKMETVGLVMDESEEEVNRWLAMSDDVFEFTVRKMGEMKTTVATAATSQAVKVPAVTGEGAETLDNKEIIKRGLEELKSKRQSTSKL